MPSVKIRWGGINTREEVYNEDHPYDEYEFETEAEVNAFLQGVDAMDGWTDWEQVDCSCKRRRELAWKRKRSS